MFKRITSLLSGGTTSSKLSREAQTELLTSLAVMAWFVEAKDPYTGGHLWRVSQYAKLMAKHQGFSDIDVARVGLGGFLHDIGKVSIEDQILRKPDSLTDDEFSIIKTHPSNGARLLAAHPLSDLVIKSVELHHERPDGQGYPFGLTQTDIPVEAAIIGVADAFDAMTSARPYRSPIPKEKALDILRQNSDRQFDSHWVDVMLQLENEGLLDLIIMHSADGIPLHECPSCGPVVTQPSDANESDLIACPLCNAQMQLVKSDDGWSAQPTGHYVDAVSNQPREDSALIQRFIAQTVVPLTQS